MEGQSLHVFSYESKSYEIKSWTALKVLKVFLLNTFWHSGPSLQTYHVSVKIFFFKNKPITGARQYSDLTMVSLRLFKFTATKYIAVHQYIQLCEEIPLGK